VQAWNLLGGEVNWAGLPIVAELLGITDIDLLVRQLALIRDFNHV
jgi:hypothetical protein